jgi:hypothetical protein
MSQAPPATHPRYSPATAAVVAATLIGLLTVVLAIVFADKLVSDDPPPTPAAVTRPGQHVVDPDAPANEVMEPEMKRALENQQAPGNP